MITTPPPPLIEYSSVPGRRRLCRWALAAPIVAAAAFMMAVFVAAQFITSRHMTLAYLTVVVCPLASIVFSLYAIQRVRRSRGLLIGTTSAVLAICFSVGSGLLCPGFTGSMEKSRHLSNISRTTAHMRQIVQACQTYADANADHFPPHLAVLLTTNAIRSDQLLDLNAPVALAPFPASLLVAPSAWRSIASDVDAHSDFMYVGADLSSVTDTEVITLYTKPGRIHKHLKFPEETYDGQGRLMAFSDLRAELVLDADIPAIFARSNTARAKLKLPPLTLDGAPPAIP